MLGKSKICRRDSYYHEANRPKSKNEETEVSIKGCGTLIETQLKKYALQMNPKASILKAQI
jgi:hypothetical protein